MAKEVSAKDAERIGQALGISWNRFDVEQFRRGVKVDFEHGSHDPQTDVTHDDEMVTGKIAWAHLKEFPDYYTRLEKMETEAKEFWGKTQ